MPYIPNEKKVSNDENILIGNRDVLDPLIDRLENVLSQIHKEYGYDMAFAGLFNYTITRLFSRFLLNNFDRVRYWHFVAVSGILSNVETEFYRRVAIPYEDVQIQKNRDVPEYLELNKTIK